MKIDRLIAIIMILLEREKISAPVLAEMFEVSTRTIYRDIDAINMAGIPIVSYTGPGGGVGILDSYKVEKRLFNTADITSLLLGLGSIRTSMDDSEIVTTLAKIRGMIPEGEQQRIESDVRRIKIDLSPWHTRRDLQPALDTARSAIEEQRVLFFTYGDRLYQKSRREAEPYRLLLKGIDWFVQGYCRTRKEARTFKLSRMRDLEISGERFSYREGIWEALDHSPGGDERRERVILRIDKRIAEEIASVYGDEAVYPDEYGGYTADIELPDNEWAYGYLLSFGDSCEIIEPRHMRQRLQELVRRIYNRYE
ncbi:helix-turn-helix transcriptional regulator [Breznakiella homolactica]|uniref:YafY family transcriptional regulator n=1 Tax=Breznakiella homolactica TaxID=2798577 RepID=A0A7T7XPB9_9SPIR|nr:YafY family protein [Breznakiella homolactica]QQO10045.1 YafY family transcriptional regulator [Breznakiella homolactica]